MFKGVFVAIITPFKNGRIDEECLRKHVSWLISNGVDGIVPCGTTGEGTTLTPPEYSKVVKLVVGEIAGRCPVIAGAGSNATAKAIELARLVMEAGANATLQVTPYYNKPTQSGLYEHFKMIASEVRSPHILYNVPGRTSVNMLPATVERLSKIKNIVGIKEASGDMQQVEDIKKSVPDNFLILSGNDDQNLDVYERGGCGTISVTANVAPAKVVEIWSFFKAGEKLEAQKAQEELAELNKAMFIETNPLPAKTSLAMMGRCKEEFRLPLTPMAVENRKKLEEVLKRYKLI